MVRQQFRDKERGYYIGDLDLEFKLPNSGEMNGIFWVWNCHARIFLSWSQLEPLDINTRRDVELAESLATKGGCWTFLCIHHRRCQTPYSLIFDPFGVFSTAQALLVTA